MNKGNESSPLALLIQCDMNKKIHKNNICCEEITFKVSVPINFILHYKVEFHGITSISTSPLLPLQIFLRKFSNFSIEIHSFIAGLYYHVYYAIYS